MEERDEKLWNIAVKRADFRKHLFIYTALILFFWIIWWVSKPQDHDLTGWPWPIWPTIGLLISLVVQYYKAFKSDKASMAEREYEKLKNSNKL